MMIKKPGMQTLKKIYIYFSYEKEEEINSESF
jgi:hypothetical protein